MSNTLGEDFERNYELFIEESMATGCVWGLQSDEGWALCPSILNEEMDVLPLWSQPEYAEAHAVDEWSQYKAVAISLEELIDDWLPGLHEDLTLVGPNWNVQMEGDEVEPLDLMEEFTEE